MEQNYVTVALCITSNSISDSKKRRASIRYLSASLSVCIIFLTLTQDVTSVHFSPSVR